MLRDGLGRGLGEERAAALYDSPQIRALHGPGGRLPSYLPQAAAPGVAGFDDLMDRMTGWYKRRVQWTVLVLALLGCVALNVDVLALGDRFLEDEVVKQAVVGQAQDGPGSPAAAAAEVAALPELGIPFGWGEHNRPDGSLGWLGKLAAWLVTAISIPMGASFWFDVLSKASRQRATGIREGARTDEEHRPVDRDDESGVDDTVGPSA